MAYLSHSLYYPPIYRPIAELGGLVSRNVPLAVLIYWLGIKGYIMSQREFPVKKESAGQNLLTAAEVEQITAALKNAMETDKLYLNPTLTVSLVAEHTGMAPRNLSAVLNQHMNKSFNEYVNGYRIQEIQRRLLQPESKELTIAGLAYECGFNSQPTFQRAFKAITGQSPREYLLKNESISR
jgi:AraC-like DNA-binding protein